MENNSPRADPEDDPLQEIKQARDEWEETRSSVYTKLEPYQRPILYVCVLAFLGFIFFVGFSMGANHVCNQGDGLLDAEYICHFDFHTVNEKRMALEKELIQDRLGQYLIPDHLLINTSVRP